MKVPNKSMLLMSQEINFVLFKLKKKRKILDFGLNLFSQLQNHLLFFCGCDFYE